MWVVRVASLGERGALVLNSPCENMSQSQALEQSRHTKQTVRVVGCAQQRQLKTPAPKTPGRAALSSPVFPGFRGEFVTEDGIEPARYGKVQLSLGRREKVILSPVDPNTTVSLVR